MWNQRLFTFFFQVFLQRLKNVQVAERSFFYIAFINLSNLFGLFSCFVISLSIFIFLSGLPSLGVREVDFLTFLREIDNHKVENVTSLDLRFVFLSEVAVESETFDIVRKYNYSALIVEGSDGALVNGTDGEDGFVNIPGILFELFVTQAEATVVGIHFKNDDLDRFANLGEFSWMFDFL